MKKEMTLKCEGIEVMNEREVVGMMASAVKAPMEWLRRYYSAILGKEISCGQSLAVTNALLAFSSVILFAGQSLGAGIASVAWLALSLLVCKREIG